MMFYTVRKPSSDVPYLDRHGNGSFQPVSMTETEATRVATQCGGVVQVLRAELEREYEVPEPVLPQLEWRVVG